MSKPDIMEIHGTTAGGLTPGAIRGAAHADLQRRQQNKGKTGGATHYAFHRKHARKATSVKDLIELALSEPGLGTASGKKATRLIYKDQDLLKTALSELSSRAIDTPPAEVP